jgi:hypothetical protein
MGKKRRALAAPQKFKARYRQIRGNTQNTTSASPTVENSVAIANLEEERLVQESTTSPTLEPKLVETPEQVTSDFREANPLSVEAEQTVVVEPVAPVIAKKPTAVSPKPVTARKRATRTTNTAKTKTSRSRKTRTKLADPTEAQ